MRRFSLFLSCLALACIACQKARPAAAPTTLKKIHFEYDSAALQPEMLAILDANTAYLKKHASVRAVIEGHCDERGTNEYNLALGDRRASIVKRYLTRQGIDTRRIRTVSYGEERPIAHGQSEASWYLNRRAEFVRQ